MTGDLAIRLACTRCHGFTEWTKDGENAVRCANCKKKHSTDSLHAVEA